MNLQRAGESIEKRIDLLKQIKDVEYNEDYAYELAELYIDTNQG